MLAKGLLYKEISAAMGVRIETIRFHIGNIYRKLHVHTRTEAVIKYLDGNPRNASAKEAGSKPEL
jgi:DNA-binding NarL/FixJ family response regulator